MWAGGPRSVILRAKTNVSCKTIYFVFVPWYYGTAMLEFNGNAQSVEGPLTLARRHPHEKAGSVGRLAKKQAV